MHEKLESSGVDASLFWRNFFGRHSIAAVTGAVYNLQGRGKPSRNFPLHLWRADILSRGEGDGDWPFIGVRWKENRVIQENRLVAFGSLVYCWPPDKKIAPGFTPMAILMTDLDCPKSDENLQKITSVLNSDFKNVSWNVLDSGNSYHLIFDVLLPPKNIPWHYGNLIKSFAQMDKNENKHFFERVGQNLQSYYGQDEKIKEACRWIFEKISHYDDASPGKIHFPLDLRWMAHSLFEWIDFMNGSQNGFGYLRAGPKPIRQFMPSVVAGNNN